MNALKAEYRKQFEICTLWIDQYQGTEFGDAIMLKGIDRQKFLKYNRTDRMFAERAATAMRLTMAICKTDRVGKETKALYLKYASDLFNVENMPQTSAELSQQPEVVKTMEKRLLSFDVQGRTIVKTVHPSPLLGI
jgi:hypothetical protein